MLFKRKRAKKEPTPNYPWDQTEPTPNCPGQKWNRPHMSLKGEIYLKKKVRKKLKKWLIIFTILVLIVIVAVPIKKQMTKILYKKEYAEYVNKYAEEYGVEKNLVYALIKAESNFNPKAISHQNANGLMQLMYPTAEELANKCQIKLTKENILDPDININLGTQYIAILLDKYECVELALAAYNAGSGNVDKWIKKGIIKSDGSDIENIPYKETNMYVRKIMRDYEIYIELES